jgi:hypothetical protein
MRWARNVAHMRVLMQKPEEKRLLGKRNALDGKVMLKWLLKKQCATA